jgi:hypothetical protein
MADIPPRASVFELEAMFYSYYHPFPISASVMSYNIIYLYNLHVQSGFNCGVEVDHLIVQSSAKV